MSTQLPTFDRQSTIHDVGLLAQNLACFGDIPQGFERILPLNVIVGRNNCGKSTLIDLVEYAICGSAARWVNRKGKRAEALMRIQLPGNLEAMASSLNYHYQGGQGFDHITTLYEYFLGKAVDVTVFARSLGEIRFENKPADLDSDAGQSTSMVASSIREVLHNPFERCVFYRLNAERDILPEKKQSTSSAIGKTGSGFSSLVQSLLLKSDADSDVIEEQLLSGLNYIYSPEIEFTRIECKEVSPKAGIGAGDIWEVYLRDRNTPSIPLTNLGSGVKTVLLAIAYLELHRQLSPHSPLNGTLPEGYANHTVIAFEEIENSLHPTLQRRLYDYIANWVCSNQATVFLTTHSPLAIDYFSKCEHSQIVHVTKEGDSAYTRAIRSQDAGSAVLSDLGVKPSDLFLTNAVIWVEGPADIRYLNRWIEIASNGQLKPGVHFQCLPFNGSGISSLYLRDDLGGTSEATQSVDMLVNMLNISRKPIIVVDSDKLTRSHSPSKHVLRVQSEAIACGGLAWITELRELENYIPPSVYEAEFGDIPSELDWAYGDVASFIGKKINEKHNLSTRKTAVSLWATERINEANFDEVEGLKVQVDAIVEHIRELNTMRTS